MYLCVNTCIVIFYYTEEFSSDRICFNIKLRWMWNMLKCSCCIYNSSQSLKLYCNFTKEYYFSINHKVQFKMSTVTGVCVINCWRYWVSMYWIEFVVKLEVCLKRCSANFFRDTLAFSNWYQSAHIHCGAAVTMVFLIWWELRALLHLHGRRDRAEETESEEILKEKCGKSV